jgi:hypothetical protein
MKSTNGTQHLPNYNREISGRECAWVVTIVGVVVTAVVVDSLAVALSSSSCGSRLPMMARATKTPTGDQQTVSDRACAGRVIDGRWLGVSCAVGCGCKAECEAST